MAIKKFEIPELLKDKPSHGACQGCGHGICWRIIYEVVEELGYKNKHVIFHDLACGSHGLFATHGHAFSGAHGRAIPTATGYKRIRPDMLVFSYAGDGATYNIGMQHTVHTAARNENITAIVVNNTNFGMTGGQDVCYISYRAEDNFVACRKRFEGERQSYRYSKSVSRYGYCIPGKRCCGFSY